MIEKIKRLFTHPYGACDVDDCDNPKMRWMSYCTRHYDEHFEQVVREIEEERFNREAEIIAEGIRRAREHSSE